MRASTMIKASPSAMIGLRSNSSSQGAAQNQRDKLAINCARRGKLMAGRPRTSKHLATLQLIEHAACFVVVNWR